MITPNNLKNYSGIQHQFLEPLHQIHCLFACIVWYLERFPLNKLDLYNTDAFVAFELRL